MHSHFIWHWIIFNLVYARFDKWKKKKNTKTEMFSRVYIRSNEEHQLIQLGELYF